MRPGAHHAGADARIDFIWCRIDLSGKERQADQDTDRVASTISKAVREVRLHPRRQPAVVPWKLEPKPQSRESVAVAATAGYAGP